jgi:methyl-accepting chemotaxis protein
MDLRLTDTHEVSTSSRQSLSKRALRALWLPGVRVMSALHMPGKLAVLIAALAVPLCLFLARDIWNGYQQQQQLRAAAQSVTVLKAVITVNHGLQHLSSLVQATLAGERSLQPAEAAQRQRLEQSTAALHSALEGATHLPAFNQWPGLHGQLRKLAVTANPLSAAEARDDFGMPLRSLHELMYQLADRGRLAHVAGAGGSDLVQLMNGNASRLVEAANELSTQGTVILSKRAEPDALERSRLIGSAWTIEREVTSAQTVLASLARHGIDAPGSWEQAVELAEQLVNSSRQRFATQHPGGSAAAYHDTAHVVVEQIVNVQQDAANRLATLITNRSQQLHNEHLVLAGAWLAGVLVIAYIATVYVLSSWGALRQLIKAMRATATGDFSHRVHVRGRDELAELAKAFDDMTERLSDHTSDIRSRAAHVDHSGRQVADSTLKLASRTEQQADSVGNVVRAFSEVSTAVTHNAQATQQLDEMTDRLFSQAESGNVAMAETVSAMDELDSASSRVAEMVAVIDDVAFQTGMLALNASVEAARAGTAGKGFAVVAGEVRQLALRCAEASEEIRTLTQASLVKVRASSGKLQHVSIAIDQLVNGVREVSSQLRTISTASSQQSASLNEVEADMESLRAITRENAELVEESTAATQVLVNLGEALTGSVGGMRLRNGSADEARALVDRAAAYASEHGRKQALADFNASPKSWIDRDLFIFCLDRSGIILANALTPGRVGLSVDTLDGLRGTHHSERLWACAQQDGDGWIRYQIVHPVTGLPRFKETFVKLIDDTTLIGCGCYSSSSPDQEAQAHSPRAVAWSRKSENLATA